MQRRSRDEKTEMKRLKTESQCFGGIAEKHEVLVSGINTLVRLAEQVFRADRGEAVSRKGAVTGLLSLVPCQWSLVTGPLSPGPA